MKRQCITGLIGISTLLLASHPTIAQAQITPDATFGAESSRLTPNVLIQGGNADRIDGGATRGSNLFHSFSQFNVADGQRLYFSSPTGVQNILTRVTGGRSDILGTLGVNGAANLFLLNPNGIVFGPNAQLDVGGSFIGTTASGVQFGNQGAFTVNQAGAPPLLTIQPSALLFTPQSIGGITSSSVAAAGTSPSGRNLLGLQVPTGQSLILAGGDVRIDGGGINGGLNAQGGRIELGGLVGSGSIGLDNMSGQSKLVFSNDGTRGNVSLVNNARVSVRGNGGGDVAVNANVFTAVDGGRIVAGTEGIGSGGEINVNANVVNFSGKSLDGIGANSGLSNQAFEDATGRGGAIKVNTNQLVLTSGASIDTATFGQASSGDILINARDSILMDGMNRLTASTNVTSISTNIQNDPNTAAVQGGKNQITTTALTMLNGSQIATGSFGSGNAGDVLVNAKTITLQGKSENEAGNFSSGFISALGRGAIGNAGNVSVQTDTLNILDGAAINSSTRGRGNAGNIKIEAGEAVLLSKAISAINASVESQGVGQGGTIQIQTSALTLANESSIDGDVRGQGNGGSILIDVANLSVERQGDFLPVRPFLGAITTRLLGTGNAGEITIKARDRIAMDSGFVSSGVLDGGTTEPNLRGKGNGGLIQISSKDIDLNRSLVLTSSIVEGNSGAIIVTAENLLRLGNNSGIAANISSFRGSKAIGNAGQINLKASSILITDGSNVASDTSGIGNAGSISISADKRIVVDGGATRFASISSIVRDEGVGQGGNIDITTPSLSLDNRGVIFTGTLGRGASGNITLNISDRLSLNNGAILFAGSGGLNEKTSKIEKSVITSRAGTITISNPRLIEVRNDSLIVLNSSSLERSGDLNINAGRFTIERSSITAEASGSDGGNINFRLTDSFILRNGSKVSTSAGTAQTGGNGGVIQISAPAIVAVPKENSDITANAFSGSGGAVNIQTNGLFGIAPSPKLTPLSDITASSDRGIQGTIAITQPDVRPEQGLTQLPVNLLNGIQLSQTCANNRANKSAGSFIITGRGSLPTSPLDPLADNPNLPRLAELPPNDRSIANTASPIITQIPTIVEAQGWQKTRDGKVILLAQPIVPTPAMISGTAGAPNGFACVVAHQK